MRVALFDPYSGASGDMVLGALVDAGASVEALNSELGKLKLAGVSVTSERIEQHGVWGTRVTVHEGSDQPKRTWRAIRQLIERSELAAQVKERALKAFERLAQAEAKVHSAPVDDVHFHEVGGVDAIVDIVGSCIGFELLGIDRIHSEPPRLGSGFASSMHGVIPVPAPATAELLAMAGAPSRPMPVEHRDLEAELLTPTGAALLTTFATFTTPTYHPERVGYGFGRRELPWPNALRLWIGEGAREAVPAEDQHEVIIETNIDDMSPQGIELLMERAYSAGALEVWVTPVLMKKNRPAVVVSAIAPQAKEDEVIDALLVNSPTFGVRRFAIDRTKADRAFVTVTTRAGDVRVKLKGWRGRVIDIAPEYDDCAALARRTEMPFREIWNEAYRIGERWVGATFPPPGAVVE